MDRRPILFLDFDGVICDSATESFVTSWAAYHEGIRGEPPSPPAEGAGRDFFRMRPLIRKGEDFMLIQDLIRRGIVLQDQESFDAEARKTGEETMRRYRETIYATRGRVIERNRAGWLGLNRIYPHVAEAFRLLAPDAPLRIISTKLPEYVVEILEASSLPVDRRHIIFAEKEPKLVTVERVRADEGFAEAVLVEDQIDAIRGNDNPRIRAYLATWGYVMEEWLRSPGSVRLLTPEGFLALVRTELGARDA